MANRSYDAVVIGGGPGGYSCAIRLGQLKQKVACIEKEEVGGVCLNWGCIPSKALIAASHLYEKAQHGGAMGIKISKNDLDVNAMQDWKGGIVKKLTGGVKGLLKANGSDLIPGTATITGPNTIEVVSVEGKKETIEAKSIVLATGSSTIEIPSFKFDKGIIGAKEAVSLREIPKRMLVIGGGVIGLELGCVYQKLGSAITVVEMTPTLLPGTDPDCTAVVERRMTKLGAKIYKSAKALGYEKQKDGSFAVRIEVAGKQETVETDCVLVAVGMRPNSKGIGLEKVGVKIDERGFVPTDKFGRTNIPS
ncbi:MAG: FAD-dependent oxidoreductase, partial [Polyangiaceae bacterium]